MIDTRDRINLIGWSFNKSALTLDWWLYSIKTTFIVGVVMIVLVVFSIWYGKKLTGVKDKRMIDIVYIQTISKNIFHQLHGQSVLCQAILASCRE